ncbi:MAG TPA: methyltransferase domain-containing protein [Woeseiaceae bacterium]|nr:methyltransferase domain-containing protein [Woeseiaceae bacterium]
MAFSKSELKSIYNKRAGNYDVSANLYYLLGFREAHYRRRAVEALDPRPGDTVVEIGCGTGLNFRYLLEPLGDKGRIIGVDLSESMLRKARERVHKQAWRDNVTLVRTDAARYRFPQEMSRAVSTFAITLMPEYDAIIRRVSESLGADGRLVILDLKRPERWPEWLLQAAVALTRPFGVTLDLAERKPWLAMQKHFSDVTYEELYGGMAFLATAENR